MEIKDTAAHVGQRVKVSGWIQYLRRQGKGFEGALSGHVRLLTTILGKIIFLELRDGTGQPPVLQAVLNGQMVRNVACVV